LLRCPDLRTVLLRFLQEFEEWRHEWRVFVRGVGILCEAGDREKGGNRQGIYDAPDAAGHAPSLEK
jgi:hypothetical protein